MNVESLGHLLTCLPYVAQIQSPVWIFFHQAERPWNKGCFPPTGRSNSPLASTCTIQWSMNLVHQYEQKHPAVILHRAECFPLPLSDRKSIYIVDCPLAMFDYRWQPAWNSEGVWLARYTQSPNNLTCLWGKAAVSMSVQFCSGDTFYCWVK